MEEDLSEVAAEVRASSSLVEAKKENLFFEELASEGMLLIFLKSHDTKPLQKLHHSTSGSRPIGNHKVNHPRIILEARKDNSDDEIETSVVSLPLVISELDLPVGGNQTISIDGFKIERNHNCFPLFYQDGWKVHYLVGK